MAKMPTFEEIRADFERGIRTVEHAAGHPFRHDAPTETPAMMPATMKPATQQEDSMSLATLEDDVKTDLTQGLDWLEGFVGRVKAAAPGIIATSEAIGGQTVGKLVEIAAGKFLPPGVEEEFLALAERYFGSFGQVPAAPAAPAAPPVQ